MERSMAEAGAVRLVETLISEGVGTVFSLSGNQIMSVYDATIGREIELIHTRHEAAAVHMADAVGRLTGEPGVALLPAGPGHCNAISALYVALMAESPVVAISGHAPLGQLGKGAFQEIDQVMTSMPVTKATWLVEDVGEIEGDIGKAFEIARTGRPGPVHLSVPEDVLKQQGSGEEAVDGRPLDSVRGRLWTEDGEAASVDATMVGEVLRLILRAERPVILAGPGMARGERWKAVETFSTKTGVPALPMMSPRGVNDPWLHEAANCLARADLVLLVGKKLDFSLRFGGSPPFAKDCRFIQIDGDEEQLREDERVVVKVHVDPETALNHLTDAFDGSASHEAWGADVRSARKIVPPEWAGHRRENSQPIHPLRVCEVVQPYLDRGGMFVSDGGEFGQWVQAGLEGSTRLINGPSGAIGSSIPMAIGAKKTDPVRTVFAFVGDGTFGYHGMELDTAIRYDLPIVVIVGNDARWNAEHQLQINTYGEERTVGCELLLSRYDRVAQALGGYGAFVQDAEELDTAVKQAVESSLPACVNVATKPVGAPTLLR